jgi:hypothetical protein
MDCGDRGDSYCKNVTSTPSLVSVKSTCVKNAFFLSRSNYTIETGIFVGILLARILVKSKYVLNA